MKLRLPRLPLLCALLTATGFTLPAAPAAVPVREKYLLLDDRLIERTENAELRVGSVIKHPQNPLFKEDKPWEVRYDNVYANVLFDQRDLLYKCWYSPFIVDPAETETPSAQRGTVRYRPHDREMGVCYATSRDGLKWEKPPLGLVEFNGSTANNLVLRRPHGSGVWRDAHDPDPARRFKLFARSSESVRQMAVAFSPDGLHWGPQTLCPEINVPGDTHNNAFWSPELGKYVGITRMKSDQRLVARTESADFLHWTKAVEVLRGDVTNQTYAMLTFRHAGVYLGLLAIFNTKTDRTQGELAWSPDTVTWQRIQPGTPLMPNSSKREDYDWGCVYPAAVPVFLDHEIRLYYGASNGPHTNWREGFFALATLRPDGFAGYVPKDEAQPAVIVTRPLTLSGRTLRLTADIGAGGWVKATLLDATGKVLTEGTRLTTTMTGEVAVALEKNTEQPVCVRLETKLAKVYSFTFGP